MQAFLSGAAARALQTIRYGISDKDGLFLVLTRYQSQRLAIEFKRLVERASRYSQVDVSNACNQAF